MFEIIRKAKPLRLYIAADGPRQGRTKDHELTLQTRKIVTRIDWECELRTLFHEQNLGCGKAPATAIDWFFSNEETGIILEDDCIPDQAFFVFCDQLLTKYLTDSRLMMISGNNYQDDNVRGDASYYFSRYSYTWGWATWRRAWKVFSYQMDFWPEFSKRFLYHLLPRKQADFWKQRLDAVYDTKINDVWDWQWRASIWSQNGLVIVPNTNLVSNIGFGQNATHTIFKSKDLMLKTATMDFPLLHPKIIAADMAADNYAFEHYFKQSLIDQFRYFLLGVSKKFSIKP